MNKVFKYVPITDLLETIIDNRGKTVPTSEKGIPLIATNCIKHSSIYPTLEKVRYVNEETHSNWFRAHLEPNDILFVNKGTPGRVCLVPDPVNFCAAQDMMAFRCNDDLIDYKYLFAVLRSDEIQKKIANNHVGLVIPHLRKQDLSSILIPIRERNEQELIGNFYVSISEKIELNNRINNELEAMAKTLYDYWFVQFDFPDANRTPYKSTGGKMVWNAELKREIPEGWDVNNLEQFVELIAGNVSPKDINTNTPYIGLEHIPRRTIVLSEWETAAKINSNKCIFKKHDILFGKIRPYFHKVGIAFIDGITSTDTIVLRPRENSYQGFALQTVFTDDFVETATNSSTGSKMPRANWNILKNYKIATPSKEILNKYQLQFNNIIKNIELSVLENQELASLRDWLLPMLMNGQVSVGNVEEELRMVAEEGARYGE